MSAESTATAGTKTNDVARSVSMDSCTTASSASASFAGSVEGDRGEASPWEEDTAAHIVLARLALRVPARRALLRTDLRGHDAPLEAHEPAGGATS